eukprot:139788_1
MPCSASYLKFQYIHATINFIILSIALFFSLKFCLNHKQNKQSLPMILHYSSNIFILVSLTAFITFIVKTISECYNSDLNQILNIIWSLSYFSQWILLLSVLFIRLDFVFKDTEYELSKYTIRIFIFMVCAMSLTFIVPLCAVKVSSPFIYYITVILMFGIAIILSLIITYLFIYKLYKVYNITYTDNASQTNNLLSTMIKNTILAMTSIGTSLLNTLNYIIWYTVFRSISIETSYPILNIFYLLDFSSNFFCIMLTFSANKFYYYKLCGCCEMKLISVATKKSNDIKDHQKLQAIA